MDATQQPTPGIVLVLDGNSLVHRAFHAHGSSASAATSTADGRPVWAVRGLLMQLVAAVERIGPIRVVVGFDDPARSLRRERWPDYKAQRADKLDTLVTQLADTAAALHDLGATVVVPDGLEADDVLASTARAAAAAGLRTVVVTSDRDAFALIDDTTHVLRIINGGVDASPVMTAARLHLLLGVRPDQYRDYAALRGDASDNLPGVRGVGPRTAARILAEFQTAGAAFDDLEAVRSALGRSIAARLGQPGSRAAWARNCEIMTMHDDLPVDLTGSGALPFAVDAVSRVFYSHNLTWTAKDALRVLGDLEPSTAKSGSAPGAAYRGGPGDRYRAALTTLPASVSTGSGDSSRSGDSGRSGDSSRSGDSGRSGGWTGSTGRRTHPPLPVRRPQPAQLSLFD